jgi:hypothetical protein
MTAYAAGECRLSMSVRVTWMTTVQRSHISAETTVEVMLRIASLNRA